MKNSKKANNQSNEYNKVKSEYNFENFALF